MNERIRELAEQANEAFYKRMGEGADKGQFYFDGFAEKFAELLIKRCGQVLDDNTPVVDLLEDWDKGYDCAINDCIHYIYEHFGVEE